MNKMLYYLCGVGGQIEVYEDRVIINRKGFIARHTHGFAGSKTIPIKSIQSVQFKEGTSYTNGFIQFGILGGIEAMGGLSSAVHDENSIFFKKASNTKAREIKDFLENKILNMSNTTTQINKETISVADEIMKYKKLLDSGVINENEFEAKKKELLNL